jgi:hypothetical protein
MRRERLRMQRLRLCKLSFFLEQRCKMGRAFHCFEMAFSELLPSNRERLGEQRLSFRVAIETREHDAEHVFRARDTGIGRSVERRALLERAPKDGLGLRVQSHAFIYTADHGAKLGLDFRLIRECRVETRAAALQQIASADRSTICFRPRGWIAVLEHAGQEFLNSCRLSRLELGAVTQRTFARESDPGREYERCRE